MRVRKKKTFCKQYAAWTWCSANVIVLLFTIVVIINHICHRCTIWWRCYCFILYCQRIIDSIWTKADRILSYTQMTQHEYFNLEPVAYVSIKFALNINFIHFYRNLHAQCIYLRYNMTRKHAINDNNKIPGGIISTKTYKIGVHNDQLENIRKYLRYLLVNHNLEQLVISKRLAAEYQSIIEFSKISSCCFISICKRHPLPTPAVEHSCHVLHHHRQTFV